MGHLLLIIYSLLAPAIAALYAVFFLLSPRRGLMADLGGELGERLGRGPAAGGQPPLWIHAASMGEVKAVSTLAPRLAAELKAPLLFTSSTAAGRAEAARSGARALLAPLDFYPLAAAFIRKNSPRALLVVETEIWPATLCAARAAGLPVFMVNARISPRTALLYRLLSPLTRLAFSGVSQVLAQSQEDAARFSSLPGLAGKVAVTGNLKHDQVGLSAAGQDKVKDFIAAAGWGSAPLFTAGSTHPPEEPFIIGAWLEARKKAPALKLALVPRHLERIAETETVLNQKQVKFGRWSAGAAPDKDCVVVDAMGLLQAFYSASAVCFVGGTMDSTGGHNLLEPALFAKPALFGANYRNARNAGNALIKGKGGFLTKTADDLALKLSELLTDPAALHEAGGNAGKTLSSLRGATARTLQTILSALRP